MKICIPCHSNTDCRVIPNDAEADVAECRICRKVLPCVKCNNTGNDADTFAEWLYEWTLPLTPQYFVARDHNGEFLCAGESRDDCLEEAEIIQAMVAAPIDDIEVSTWRMQWRELSQIDRDLWEKRAEQVRRAVARGGFEK